MGLTANNPILFHFKMMALKYFPIEDECNGIARAEHTVATQDLLNENPHNNCLYNFSLYMKGEEIRICH